MLDFLAKLEVKIDGERGQRKIEGYASVFNVVDSHGDIVVPGAFAKTLAKGNKSGELPMMLLEHGESKAAADMPIGVWTELKEDSHGLLCKGVLSPTSIGEEVYGLMTMQPRPALNGVSIGFYARKSKPASKGSGARRILEEVDLEEISIVGRPSNTFCRALAAKSASAFTIREFETALERGTLPPLSSTEAKKLLSGGFKAMNAARDAGDDEAAQLASRFRALRA